MIVLILFTICQFTLLIMNHMLFQGIPSAWNQIGIPVVAISFFTEAVLVINSYRNSKNKVLEQKKERLGVRGLSACEPQAEKRAAGT